MDIAKLSFKYDAPADRLRVAISGKGERTTLLLTRRLAIQWLRALAQWLETGADPVLGLEIAHGRALSRLERAMADAPPREAEGKASGEPVLVSTIKCVQSTRSIKIGFYASQGKPLAEGEFARVAGHGLLDRLVRVVTRAGWGDALPIPEWSRAANEEKRSASKATLH